jgi:hypothetical protein
MSMSTHLVYLPPCSSGLAAKSREAVATGVRAVTLLLRTILKRDPERPACFVICQPSDIGGASICLPEDEDDDKKNSSQLYHLLPRLLPQPSD